ncbi:MAG TPA: hypothetical protein VM753_22260 [Anaeromyxobacter sp.]|jgi:hypothetical protein|nr:hypothetical protein [Anaeromyxobacter sp.]
MRKRTRTLTIHEPGWANRRVGDVRAEVRAALSPDLDAGARRRAERRVRLLAALLDGGGPSGLVA